jgi:hypothetical protein
MAKKKEKGKGLLDRAIDAVSTRDEKAAVEEAEKETSAARTQATQEATQKRAAQARARTAQAQARAAEERAKAAEKAAAEAKAQAARLERDQRVAKIREEAERRAQEREAAKARVYVVKSGDSLSKIAKENLGDANRWPEIFELNKDKIKNPNLIHLGQELKMPEK